MGKTVKPRTNLILDTALFSLVLFHLTAAVAVNVLRLHPGPAYESWHVVLGITGGTLAIVVATHLWFHLSWIKAQIQQRVRPRSRNRADSRYEG